MRISNNKFPWVCAAIFCVNALLLTILQTCINNKIIDVTDAKLIYILLVSICMCLVYNDQG